MKTKGTKWIWADCGGVQSESFGGISRPFGHSLVPCFQYKSHYGTEYLYMVHGFSPRGIGLSRHLTRLEPQSHLLRAYSTISIITLTLGMLL